MATFHMTDHLRLSSISISINSFLYLAPPNPSSLIRLPFCHAPHALLYLYILSLTPLINIHSFVKSCFITIPRSMHDCHPRTPSSTFLSLHHSMHLKPSRLSMAMHGHLLPISAPSSSPPLFLSFPLGAPSLAASYSVSFYRRVFSKT